MRIAVIGVGSIGGLILGALSTTNHDLVAVSRAGRALGLSVEGLVLHHHDGPIEMIPPSRFEVIDTTVDQEASQISGSIDIAIICGKSRDTELLGRIARNRTPSFWYGSHSTEWSGECGKTNRDCRQRKSVGGINYSWRLER